MIILTLNNYFIFVLLITVFKQEINMNWRYVCESSSWSDGLEGDFGRGRVLE